MSPEASASIVFVGGGPRTVSVLERLAANLPGFPGRPMILHVVDPHPAGGGRIWRQHQSPLLWMNSITRDVTMFTDSSVSMQGPVVPGPSLAEWIPGFGREFVGERTDLGPDDFAGRDVQSQYLGWVHRGVIAGLPGDVRVVEHLTSAVSVTDRSGAQEVALADGTVLRADIVVLAQGFLDRTATPAQADLLAGAARHGLTCIPPGYTADIDLSGLRAGEDVVVRGFGLAFIDLMVLVCEGRGGRFDRTEERLTYLPSGREPVLHVGSRRGVPYHSKLGYLRESGPTPTRYLTTPALAAHGSPVDYRTVVWPLLVKELAYAHYRELFAAHPERTSGTWDDFLQLVDRTPDVRDPGFLATAAAVVPEEEDRFDIDRIDRPLGALGRSGPVSDGELQDVLVGYIEADLVRRADAHFSQDAAVFDALLSVYMVLAEAVVSQRISPQDRVRNVEGTFHGLFSFLASGPPPQRLRELLALHRAGIVRFLGPDLQVELDEADEHSAAFVAHSPAGGAVVRARAFIDAFLPAPDVKAASDPVIRGLLASGELAAEDLRDEDGVPLGSGQLLADKHCRAIRADGTVHPRRYLLGPSVSGSAGSAGFARPGYNSPGFRQNDAVARELLGALRTPEAPVRSRVPALARQSGS
ncbi:hypothetical protein GIS00_22145 [Nakamurella sp. YIM 132087]|uniref:FAD-dependent urate hydroxylase HpyO/Asp monooxygenase CreE-like FAD/NAD(P)-binding domain-containing protein n=1 Tax=Nakamurella alba TaxID=2665158 RepID=A0A7K1FR66_9ACTN|nr:hypothetical protein [Nakamurella alba]